jgi:hypothetical protein
MELTFLFYFRKGNVYDKRTQQTGERNNYTVHLKTKKLNFLKRAICYDWSRNSAIRLLYTAVSTTIIAHIVIMARSFALWLNGLSYRYMSVAFAYCIR